MSQKPAFKIGQGAELKDEGFYPKGYDDTYSPRRINFIHTKSLGFGPRRWDLSS